MAVCFLALVTVQLSVLLVQSVEPSDEGYSPTLALATTELLQLGLSMAFLAGLSWLQGSQDSKPRLLEQMDDVDGPALVQADGTSPKVSDHRHSRGSTTHSSGSSVWSRVLRLSRSELSPALWWHLCGLAVLYCVNSQVSAALLDSAKGTDRGPFTALSTAMRALLLSQVFARPIDRLQWAAIALQMVGLALLQSDPLSTSDSHSSTVSLLLLSHAVMTAACSVWNEQLLKRFPTSLLAQNTALSSVRAALYLVMYWAAPLPCLSLSQGDGIGLMASCSVGTGSSALLAVFLNSALGLLVPVVYRYADALVETFASASAVALVLCLNGGQLSSAAPTSGYAATVVVLIAAYVYITVQQRGGMDAIRGLGPDGRHPPHSPSGPSAKGMRAMLGVYSIALLVVGAVLMISVSLLISQAAVDRVPVLGSPAMVITSASPLLLRGHLMLHGHGLPLANHSESTQVLVNGVYPCLVVGGSARHIECALPDNSTAIPHNRTAWHVSVANPSLATSWVGSVTVERLVGHWERHDILLVLFFNYVTRYDRIAELLPLYSRIFASIVVVGPEPYEGVDILCSGSAMWSYACLSNVTVAYPHHSGYLLQHFDVALNFQQLERLDLQRMWSMFALQSQHKAGLLNSTTWFWPFFSRSVNASMAEVASRPPYARFAANYVRNVGSLDLWLSGLCDLFYLPSRFVVDWAVLGGSGGVFHRHRVFSEMAFPLLTALISPSWATDVVVLTGAATANETEILHYMHRTEWDYAHQVPLTNEMGWDAIRDTVNRGVAKHS